MQQISSPEAAKLEDTMTPRSDQKDEVVDDSKSGSESASAFQEDDAEAAELARLRCESVRIEGKKQPCKS